MLEIYEMQVLISKRLKKRSLYIFLISNNKRKLQRKLDWSL